MVTGKTHWETRGWEGSTTGFPSTVEAEYPGQGRALNWVGLGAYPPWSSLPAIVETREVA